MPILTPSWVIVDCADAERLASFWGELLGVAVGSRKGPYVFLERSSDGIALGFQRVQHPGSGKNRLHLDLTTDDLAAAVAAIEALGGRRAAGYEEGGFLVMADPEDNVFCLLPQGSFELDDTGRAHYPHP